MNVWFNLLFEKNMNVFDVFILPRTYWSFIDISIYKKMDVTYLAGLYAT